MADQPDAPPTYAVIQPVDPRTVLPPSSGDAPNAADVTAFNNGFISSKELLHRTVGHIHRCQNDAKAGVACVTALSDSRDPHTGRPVSPDRKIFEVALETCARAPLRSAAIQLFNSMLVQGIYPDERAYASAMVACHRCGDDDDAVGLFQHLQDYGWCQGVYPTQRTSALAISCYGQLGRVDDAFRVFRHMQDRGLPLDASTCNRVLVACRRGGRPELAWRLFQQMLQPGPTQQIELDHVAYLTAMLACGSRRISTLIDLGVQNGVFDASLGYSAETCTIDLRQQALVAPHLRDGNHSDLPVAVARTLLNKTARKHPPDQPLQILASEQQAPLFRLMYEGILRERALRATRPDHAVSTGPLAE